MRSHGAKRELLLLQDESSRQPTPSASVPNRDLGGPTIRSCITPFFS